MTVLGKFDKQPVEREVYSISFIEDMTPTDEIETAWQMVGRTRDTAWDRTVKATDYTATLADDGVQIVALADVDPPASPPQGYRLRVANQNAAVSIDAAGITLLPRTAVVLYWTGMNWAIEVKTEAVLINTAGDQRVRTFVSEGLPGNSYKVDVTVMTSEGRTLQDEFIVKIKEN